MIFVTCLNGEHFSVDADLIERVESRPDTTIVLVDRTHFVVSQSVEEVQRAVQAHRAQLLVGPPRMEWAGAANPTPGRHRGGGLATRGHTQAVLATGRSAR